MYPTVIVRSLFALFQASGAGLPERAIANIFRPMATPAADEKNLAYFVFAITGAIFIVVGGLIVFTILRFRRRPGDDWRQEPPQVYGSNQIEVAWTVIPILIVFVLIGVTARVGHQWWWQVEYPDYGIVTANEIHVPVYTNRKGATYLQLESMDVIHSFWVPQLAGKTDLIPNRANYMWIDPQEPGIYFGNCAEYCGTQHANMLLRVVAQPEADFRAWAAEQQKPATEYAQATAAGKAMFESLSCVNCHVVKGTPATGKFGPDLTHLMSRQMLGSGVITNTRDHLRAWINDPGQIKPGVLMPSMKLTDPQLDQVVAYLESLN
jgi:cytochrome c oxidase subunit II